MSGYIPSVPTANQKVSQTQAPINTNFNVINNSFNVDHVNIQTLTNQGNHNKVTLVNQAAPLGAVAQGPIIHSTPVTYPGPVTKNELFLFQTSGDGGADVQLSNFFNAVVGSNQGSSFLPGGIVIKWGTFNMGLTIASKAVSFINKFPHSAFTLVLTQTSNDPLNEAGFTQGSLSDAGFTAIRAASPANNLTYHYIAIGN